MKKTLLFISFLLSTFAHAAPMDERPAVCYTFVKGKLQSRDVCILATGYGAGGSYANIQIGKQIFNAETRACYDKKLDNDVECGVSLNGEDARHYYRDLFYSLITDSTFINDNSLSCYVSKSRKTDICFK